MSRSMLARTTCFGTYSLLSVESVREAGRLRNGLAQVVRKSLEVLVKFMADNDRGLLERSSNAFLGATNEA